MKNETQALIEGRCRDLGLTAEVTKTYVSCQDRDGDRRWWRRTTLEDWAHTGGPIPWGARLRKNAR